ncbi:MAG: nitrilase-related carbon-nitrogen hydrolase, partial [Calditrichota bacterium]
MLKVGFYQFYPRFGKVEKNLETVVRKLKDVKADLIVLPELAFTGYHFRNKEELSPLAEAPASSKVVNILGKLCAQKNMYIVSGFAEKDGDQLYNSAVLLGPKGLIHIYRKIQLFLNEKNIFQPGNIPLQVHKIKNVNIGMMICFDWIFPEITRSLMLLGADIICHPSNLVLNYCQQSMITRCLENNIFAVTCNRYGAERRPHGTLKFTGKSQIVAPRG